MKLKYFLYGSLLIVVSLSSSVMFSGPKKNINLMGQNNDYSTSNRGSGTYNSSSDPSIKPEKTSRWPQWLRVGGKLTWESGNKKTASGRLLDEFRDDRYGSLSAYQIDAIEEKLESEYGPLDSPALSITVKKGITRKYWELFFIFNLRGGGYKSLPVNPILSKLCRNSPQFYEYVMECVATHGASAGRVEYMEDLLTYNRLTQNTADIFFGPDDSPFISLDTQERRASFGEAGERLQRLAKLSKIQQCAQSEDILQHGKELSPLKEVAFGERVFPSELSVPVSLISEWIDYTTIWASYISQQRTDKANYGRYPITDPAFIKRFEDALVYLGQNSDATQYQDNDGLEIHADTKTALVQAIEGVQRACKEKKYPRLEQIEGRLKSIFWHTLLETHEGYIVKPSKLLLLAQSMALMARARDLDFPLIVPLSFVQPELLHEQVSNALLRSNSLYFVPPFKDLVQRLPEYPTYFKQLVSHPSQCKQWQSGSLECAVKIIPEERADFEKLIQDEEKQRLQEEAEESELTEQIKLMIEAEIQEYQNSVAKLTTSSLDIVHRRRYIQEREQAWHDEREKKRAELENGGQWDKAILSDDAVAMIASQGRSTQPFQELVNSAEGQVLQNEFIVLANESAKPWEHDPALQGPLPEMMLQFAEAGSRFVMASDLNSAHLVANSGNAMREYFYAFSRGVANGIIGAGKDLAGFLLHPKAAIIERSNQFYNLSYQLGRVLHVVADVAFSYDLDYEDQLQAWERGERNAQVLYNDVSEFYQVLKHHYDTTPGPKLLEEVTEGLMRAYARKLLVGATLDCVGNGLNKAANSINNAMTYKDPPAYILYPNETFRISYAVPQVVTEATVEAQSIGRNVLWAVISGKDSPGTGRYRTVEELLEDAKPLEGLPGSKATQGEIKGDAKKIFAELAASYGEKIVRRGTTLIFGKKPNVVSLHLSKVMDRPTISFEIGKIKYKIRINP